MLVELHIYMFAFLKNLNSVRMLPLPLFKRKLSCIQSYVNNLLMYMFVLISIGIMMMFSLRTIACKLNVWIKPIIMDSSYIISIFSNCDPAWENRAYMVSTKCTSLYYFTCLAIFVSSTSSINCVFYSQLNCTSS